MVGVILSDGMVSDSVLLDLAREFSPRVEVCGPHEVALDLNGLVWLFGDSKAMGDGLRRAAIEKGVTVRVAIADSRTAARLLARGRLQPAEIAIVGSGGVTAALAPLPIELLASLDMGAGNGGEALLALCRRWGLCTLGELVALPSEGVAARLGQDGVRWQRLARGEDPQPLLPSVPDEQFEEMFDLEWPIDSLESLKFILRRLLEPLSTRLQRRGRAVAVLHVRLYLVTRTVHERSLQLPTPIHNANTLRTLALLDLESHPPGAAIDRVVVAVEPTPIRMLQCSLFTRAQSSTDKVSTLLARLYAVMGEDRCGSPVPKDSWRPGAFTMTRFSPSLVIDVERGDDSMQPTVALRRHRTPVPARVRMEQGCPVRVTTERRGLYGGRVDIVAGPWRTSGNWWYQSERERQNRQSGELALPTWWDRDEWDVSLGDGATYRIFYDRITGDWFIEGVID